MLINEYIGIEQARALSRQALPLVVQNLAAGVIPLWLFWGEVPQRTLLLWFLVVLIIAVGRILMAFVFKLSSITASNYNKYLWIFVFWLVLDGFVWGAAIALFHNSDDPLYTLFLMCMLSAHMSMVVFSVSLFLPAFLGFILPIVCLTFLSLIKEELELYRFIAFTMPFFLLAMTVFARTVNRNFKTTKNLEFDNAKLLDEVTQQKNIAETAVIAKNQFLSATSHDLRQPLHAMGLYIDTLIPRLSDPFNRNILEKIEQSSSSLNELLHSLLDISRLDASMVEHRPQHVHLDKITQQLFSEFSSESNERELDLSFEVDDNCVLFADPILLERVIRNLLSNALKYTESGFVKLLSVEHKDTVEIKVIDSGVGVSKQDIETIFSEFTQLRNPQRDRNNGLGLGLAIVERLCLLQAISLDFKSELGSGTTVSLSVRKGDEALCVLDKFYPKSIDQQLTILFVDDDEAIRDSMKLVISSWQCVPYIASGKDQAMGIVQSLDEDIDIIISDLRLAEQETGIELVRQIREEVNQEIPAIIITGDTAVDRLELTKQADVLVVHKPIQPADLRQAIQQLLSRSGQA